MTQLRYMPSYVIKHVREPCDDAGLPVNAPWKSASHPFTTPDEVLNDLLIATGKQLLAMTMCVSEVLYGHDVDELLADVSGHVLAQLQPHMAAPLTSTKLQQCVAVAQLTPYVRMSTWNEVLWQLRALALQDADLQKSSSR